MRQFTRQRTRTFKSSFKYRNAHGIKNWLVKNRYILHQDDPSKVKEDAYIDLVSAFCLSQGFDATKSKGITSYESFIQNRFSDFKEFARKKYAEGERWVM